MSAAATNPASAHPTRCEFRLDRTESTLAFRPQLGREGLVVEMLAQWLVVLLPAYRAVRGCRQALAACCGVYENKG